MWLCKYFVYFLVYSIFGWIYETIFVTARTRKWDNRGFLMGPIVPIYGVGGGLLTAIIDFIESGQLWDYKWWQIFLIGVVGSIFLEYSTSYILEKIFHARWWDYSYMPLNVNGRICAPYSLAFGVAALVVVYVLAPFVRDLLSWVTPIWYEFFALTGMGWITMDTTLTISALSDFDENITSLEEEFNARMAERVEEMVDRQEARALKRAEKRLYTQEQLENAIQHMGALRRSALRRVETFSKPGVENVHVQNALANLKQQRKEKRASRRAACKEAAAKGKKNQLKK